MEKLSAYSHLLARVTQAGIRVPDQWFDHPGVKGMKHTFFCNRNGFPKKPIVTGQQKSFMAKGIYSDQKKLFEGG